MNEAREQADRAADRIRSELLATLHELDRRRHHAFEKHFTLVMAVAGCAVVAAGIGLALAVARARSRRESSFGARLRELTRAWKAPEPLAYSGALPVVSAAAARKLATVVAVTFAAQLARWSAQRLLPSGLSR